MAKRRVSSSNRRSTKPQWTNLEQLEARVLLSATDSSMAAALAETGIMTPALEAPAVSPFDTISAHSSYTPAQIRAAYGFNSIVFTNSKGQKVTGDGTGETIAIIDAYNDTHIAVDLRAFDAYFGISDKDGKGAFALTTVMMAPANKMTTDAGWAMETALDVEWAHAIAPGAHILLVEAASSSVADLLAAVNYARRQKGVVAISMSWGGGEMRSEKYYDAYFTTPAGHKGITFVTASGDSGAGAQWPSVSPNVVAVGGTTLSTTSTDAWDAESAWGGSGGGVSMYETKPIYQNLNTLGEGYRTNPDVAFDADPNTGYAVYDNGRWLTVGGTSAGAPIWAGLFAIADQGRALKGKGSLNGATQTLKILYSLSANDFHDITVGTNGFSAMAGYDLTTGRGSPKANLIATDLLTVGTMVFPKTAATTVSAVGVKLGYNLAGSGDWQSTSSPAQSWGTTTSDVARSDITSSECQAAPAGEAAVAATTLSPWTVAQTLQLQRLTPQDGSGSFLVGTTSGQDQNAPMVDSALSIAGKMIDPLDVGELIAL
jgi:subtilase family serine protease